MNEPANWLVPGGNTRLQTPSTSTLATALLPPTRDCFDLPRFDSVLPGAPYSSYLTQPAAASTYKLPPLDFQQQQASQKYWPGASSSTPATAAQALSTLPTPPSDGSDGFKLPNQNIKAEYNSLAAVQQPSMASHMESTGAPSSLTARRPAAVNLPNFELPPVPFSQYNTPKYVPLPAMNANTSSVSVGNLLTPPSTIPSDSLSPISQALNSATSSQPPSNYSNISWPPLNLNTNTGLTPLGLGSSTSPPLWNNPLNNARGLFSPSLAGTLATRGNSNSPTAGDSLPPPPYDMNQLPPLPTTSMPMPMSIPAAANAQQMAQAQAYMAQNQTQTQTPLSATTTQASPVNGTDAYSQRPQSTPSTLYYNSQPSPAQQNSFPNFNNNSNSPPGQQSPMSAPPQVSRISPMNGQNAPFSPPTSQAAQFGRSAYPQYPLPAMSGPLQMNGPIMSNIHNPNNPMGMVGMQNNGLPGGLMPGYHSGHAAHLQQQMYGTQSQPAHNERPFKCDQCPQSFNRNHDLKRHKRIHLAVKPFPCGWCEKSFSRKDALKVSFFLHSTTGGSLADLFYRGISL